jgi:hypothetical protein
MPWPMLCRQENRAGIAPLSTSLHLGDPPRSIIHGVYCNIRSKAMRCSTKRWQWLAHSVNQDCSVAGPMEPSGIDLAVLIHDEV